MIELKWDLLAAKSLAAASSKAAYFSNSSVRVQEVAGEMQLLLFDKDASYPSLLPLCAVNFQALISVRES